LFESRPHWGKGRERNRGSVLRNAGKKPGKAIETGAGAEKRIREKPGSIG